MKATELMIGDWVIHDYYKTPIQIKAIPNAEQIYHPIPLTPEILEKNGIKFQYGQPWYQLHNDRIQIVCGEMRLCVDYVHTLQHALRLCGLDELADNFKV